MSRVLAGLAVLALLAGCVRAPIRQDANAVLLQAQAERERVLAAQLQWSLVGRLAVSDGRDGGSGRIEWTQDGDDFEIRLSAPVSRQSWRLSRQHGLVTLEGVEGGPIVGADPQRLLWEATGWLVPVDALAAWVRGARAGDAAGACAAMGGVPLILEALVPFEREISVIAARGRDGIVSAYDPAENVHRDGILHSSTVPAAGNPAALAAAREAARAILDGLGYVGVIGVEFFALADGSVLANEIAPRVHNSGHWTEAACAVSQFEQHIRAVAGLPLGDPGRHSDCVMENLIGDDVARVPALLAEKDVVVHLYGKEEARPGRKMGHFTRLAPRQR